MLPLKRGDAAVHQSDLLHGVKVESGERWSWILWFRDSATCEEHGHEWFASCAEAGDAICASLHSGKTGHLPGLKPQEAFAMTIAMNEKAAAGGDARAMVKLARASLKQARRPT